MTAGAKLAARLRRIGHFGIVAGPSGAPLKRPDRPDDAFAYDYGAVAALNKRMSIVHAIAFDSSWGTLARRGALLDDSVAALRRTKNCVYLSFVDVNPRVQNKGTVVLFREPRFYEAVAMALMHSVFSRKLIPPRFEEYIIGTQLGYPRRDILARYAWRTSVPARYGDDFDDAQALTHFHAGFDAARRQFDAMAAEADAFWAALMASPAFRKEADAYRPLLKKV